MIILCRVGEGDGEGGEGGDGGEGEGGEGGAKEKQNIEGEGEGAQGEAVVEGGGGGQVETAGGGGGGEGGGGEVNCEATQAYTFNEDDQMDFEPTALVRTTTGMSPYSHVSIPPYLYQYVVYPPSLCFLFMLSCFHTLILSFSHTHTAIPPFQL